MITVLRPDKYLRMAAETRRGVNATSGVALAAIRRPDAIGLIDDRGELTWRELNATCDALALALQRAGRSAVVGIMCRNHRGFVQALVAAGRIGADTVFLNTGFAGPQLLEVVTREGIDVLIHDDEFAAAVASVEDPAVLKVVAWHDAAPAPGTTTLDGLVAEARGTGRPTAPDRPGRLVLLTSGTTGTPKGARRPSGGSMDDLAVILDNVPWRAEERIVIAAPTFHGWGFGQLLLAATLCCTVVLSRRFDPERTLELAARHRATGLVVVPVMLERIMDLPSETRARFDLSALRFVTASGSRLRPDVVTGFMDFYGDVLHNNYNATEVGMVSVASPSDLRAAPDTAGRLVAGTDVVLLDPDGAEVGPGEVGEICVRTSTTFDGYTDGSTKESRSDRLSSGDLGRWDDSGLLYVVGRTDDMIISGGENVYPIEVENALALHPAVRDVAVVGAEDRAFGQRLVAFVALVGGATVTDNDLRQHVKGLLAGYKVPRDVVFLDELPRNDAGKVLARELVVPGDDQRD
jgi:acyl-CoA synthetase (AMP-forming)/AMP-acid ligase II